MVLSFRLGKIPVRVLPSFFLIAVLLGASGGTRAGIAPVVAWVAVVLVSVTIHELGHAATALAFGLEPRIELHGMGGTTSWGRSASLSPGRRVAISVAGPAAGFAFAALVFLARGALGRVLPGGMGGLVLGFLLWVNVGWGILNLLPMLPLDGGDAMMQTLHALTGGRGERPARIVSLVCASLATALAVATQWWWSALLAGSFAVSNWRALKALSAVEHDDRLRGSLEPAYEALEAKDGPRLLELARPVALAARTAPVKAEALQLLAFGFLLEGRAADADAAIAAMPEGFSPHPSLAELRQKVHPPPPGQSE